MVDRAARTYELDETQKSLVRIEMENMQRERREAMGPEAEEYEKLREQLFHYWRPRSDGSEANPTDREDRRERRRRMMEDPEYLKTRERLRTLEQKYPVNWEDAMHRVEVLLPADQAEKGRKQIEERLARREEREQRWQDRSEGRRSRRNASDSNTPAGSFGDRSTPPKTESPSPDAQTVQTPPAPPHPWEIYVRHFIAEHELTTAQQAAAMAILKDVRSRAGQIELSLREKIAAAEKLADPASRIKRLGELHQPIEQLFTELKTRLDGLLTASQRAPAPRS